MTREEHKALSDKFNGGHATLREALTLALAELDEGAPAAPVTHEGNSVIRARAIVSVALRMAAAVPAVPAPPGPVEHACDSCQQPEITHAADCARIAALTCPTCRAPVAPAPGVGEGPRELTFAEAMVLDPEEVEVRIYDGIGTNWHPLAAMLDCTLSSLRQCKFRLKPAPAPKPGRVAELLNNFFAHREVIDVRLAKKLCRQVVDAHQEAVLNEACEECVRGQVIERARVALLGAEAGK